jgi:hypothetical protein
MRFDRFWACATFGVLEHLMAIEMDHKNGAIHG